MKLSSDIVKFKLATLRSGMGGGEGEEDKVWKAYAKQHLPRYEKIGLNSKSNEIQREIVWKVV